MDNMQKSPFTFRLSAFTFFKGFLLCAFCFLLSTCKMNPNMQTPGQAWLQGEWQQDSVPAQKQLISYLNPSSILKSPKLSTEMYILLSYL